MGALGRATVLAMCVFSLAASGCGGDDASVQRRIDRERKDAARQARQEERIKQLEREQKNLTKQGGASQGSGGRSGGSGGAVPAGKACGGGLSVGANTTCAFAQGVRAAYVSSGGASTFIAHSPVTGQDYEMSCTSDSPHVCTGGNNATVYFP